MSIVNVMRYESPIAEIKSEEDLIGLLRDVKAGLTQTDSRLGPMENLSLVNIAKLVVRGSYEHRLKINDRFFPNSIDLTQAAQLVQGYREASEGGCLSCANYKVQVSTELPGERAAYCLLLDKDFANLTKTSATIDKYFAKGCKEIVRRFKPIEEVLKDL